MTTGPAIPARLGPRQAQPLEGFLEQTEKVSIDALMARLEGTPAVAKELEAERAQVAALAAKFAESEFRPVLEWLLDISLRRPHFLPGLGQEAVQYCAYREGQNSVVWQLMRAIAQGRDELPPQREGL